MIPLAVGLVSDERAGRLRSTGPGSGYSPHYNS
jgi:hypothetical protein